MPILQLRQHLAVIAQFDDDWGAAGRGAEDVGAVPADRPDLIRTAKVRLPIGFLIAPGCSAPPGEMLTLIAAVAFGAAAIARHMSAAV